MRFPLNIGDFNLRKNGDQNLQINKLSRDPEAQQSQIHPDGYQYQSENLP